MSDDVASNFTFHDLSFACHKEKTVQPYNFGVNCSKVGLRSCSLLIALFKYFGSKEYTSCQHPFSHFHIVQPLCVTFRIINNTFLSI